jgi:aryl-alcohol dehydrogenase-like predicted oxidoreductase
MSTFALGPMQVRRSGYGAQLAGGYAFGTPPDRASAIGVLRTAVAAGVDHIDTAQYYGPGTVNHLIREDLYPYPRRRRTDRATRFPGRKIREGVADHTDHLVRAPLPCGE